MIVIQPLSFSHMNITAQDSPELLCLLCKRDILTRPRSQSTVLHELCISVKVRTLNNETEMTLMARFATDASIKPSRTLH